ncbi:MAG: hypothetical protein AB1656_26360 [Candidatus Omnitrophota bacterium]
MWERAKGREREFRFSILFTAQDVGNYLNSDEEIRHAAAWCKDRGFTRIFLETFRNGYSPETERLARARDLFRQLRIDVSGCVAPTGMGIPSNQCNAVSNYEAPETLTECRRLFEGAASIFDEILIDGFLYTDDDSEASLKARGDQSWMEYRCDLMLRVCREAILGPARLINPRVEVMLKYPPWYDLYPLQGCNVETQTDLFDHIWAQTPTLGEAPQRRSFPGAAFFLLRWLADIGPGKMGGGCIDACEASPDECVEQARQIILGGAKEALLHHFGGLQNETGAVNAARLLEEIPNLFLLAEAVAEASPAGILAPQIPNSDPGGEPHIYSRLSLLGWPLAPLSRIDVSYPAVLFAAPSWQSDIFPAQFDEFLEEKKPIALTGNLRHMLQVKGIHFPESIAILEIPQETQRLLELNSALLQSWRDRLLYPLGLRVSGPAGVSLYLFDNGLLAVENFLNQSVEFLVECRQPLDDQEREHARKTAFALPNEHSVRTSIAPNGVQFVLDPHSLAVVKLAQQRFQWRR